MKNNFKKLSLLSLSLLMASSAFAYTNVCNNIKIDSDHIDDVVSVSKNVEVKQSGSFYYVTNDNRSGDTYAAVTLTNGNTFLLSQKNCDAAGKGQPLEVIFGEEECEDYLGSKDIICSNEPPKFDADITPGDFQAKTPATISIVNPGEERYQYHLYRVSAGQTITPLFEFGKLLIPQHGLFTNYQVNANSQLQLATTFADHASANRVKLDVYLFDPSHPNEKRALKDSDLSQETVLSSPFVAENGNVYISSGSGYVYAFDWNGKRIWRVKLTSNIALGAPTVDMVSGKPVVFIGAADGRVYARNADTGADKWNRYITRDTTEAGFAKAPVVDTANQTVYVVDGSDALYALDENNGQTKWWSMKKFKVATQPVIGADGTVYVGVKGAKVLALDPKGDA